jgi:hypothetical protein
MLPDHVVTSSDCLARAILASDWGAQAPRARGAAPTGAGADPEAWVASIAAAIREVRRRRDERLRRTPR